MPSPEPLGPPLRPPQFRLRTLLALLTICGGLLALTQWLAPLTVVAIGFLLVCIGAHVAGNALGNRLRQPHGDFPDTVPKQFRDRSRPALSPEHFAPPTRLRESSPLGWPLLVATMVGIVGGGAVGGIWVILTSAHAPTELDIVVGIVACSVLGGIFSFVAIGFLQVGAGALWQTFQAGQRMREPQSRTAEIRRPSA